MLHPVVYVYAKKYDRMCQLVSLKSAMILLM